MGQFQIFMLQSFIKVSLLNDFASNSLLGVCLCYEMSKKIYKFYKEHHVFGFWDVCKTKLWKSQEAY